jgi:hypothetical protein
MRLYFCQQHESRAYLVKRVKNGGSSQNGGSDVTLRESNIFSIFFLHSIGLSKTLILWKKSFSKNSRWRLKRFFFHSSRYFGFFEKLRIDFSAQLFGKMALKKIQDGIRFKISLQKSIERIELQARLKKFKCKNFPILKIYNLSKTQNFQNSLKI